MKWWKNIFIWHFVYALENLREILGICFFNFFENVFKSLMMCRNFYTNQPKMTKFLNQIYAQKKMPFHTPRILNCTITKFVLTWIDQKGSHCYFFLRIYVKIFVPIVKMIYKLFGIWKIYNAIMMVMEMGLERCERAPVEDRRAWQACNWGDATKNRLCPSTHEDVI